MRGTVAKRLRKKARQLSAGMHERQIIAAGKLKTIWRGRRRHSVQVNMALNAPQTTRGIYRSLKKKPSIN